MAHPFDIAHLDHVGITAQDMERSAAWYQKVLGLKRYDVDEWGGAPIFLIAGTTGLAIFPAGQDDPDNDTANRNVRIDHYAFNVSQENFQTARKHYDNLGLTYTVKDHIYFHSMYTKDPDGHVVELTTLLVEEKEFYT